MEPVKAAIRKQVRNWCPPIVADFVHYIKKSCGAITTQPTNDSILFCGNYKSWEDAVKESEGYDSERIVAKVKDAALKVQRGEAAYEQDSVVFEKISYPWPLLSHLLFSASLNCGRLHVLDFGGSLGSIFFRCQRYFRELTEVNWAVVEQPLFVDAGRELEGNGLRFFNSVDDAWDQVQPNVLLLGSVLQYLPSPYVELESLLRHPWKMVLVDRTAMLPESNCDRLTVQNIPATIYEASYPAWFLSKSRFEAAFHQDFELVANWHNCDHYLLDGDQTRFEGFCFERK